MILLAKLEEVKAALGIDFTDRDPTLDIYIRAASQAVLRYIKSDGTEFEIAEGAEPTGDHSRVKLATICLVGYWYENPDADPNSDFERGYLPRQVTAILYDLRDPTVA